MNDHIKFITLVLSFLITIIACEKDIEVFPENNNYDDHWKRIQYAWTGSFSIDTVSINQVQDSLFIIDGELLNEIGIIGSDTIEIVKSNVYPTGFKYLLIISDNKLISNSPITRLIDSIEFRRVN